MSASSLPPAITPIYRTLKINQNIKLYEGSLEIVTDSGTWPGSGEIQLKWLPEPAIRLDCQYTALDMLNQEKAQLKIPNGSRPFDVTPTSTGIGCKGPDSFATLSGIPKDLMWGTIGNMHSLLFHVPNFAYFKGAQVQDPENAVREARANVSTEGWNIVIDSLADFSFQKFIDLGDSSGNAITHVGTIKKVDGSSFTVVNVQEVLEALFFWLSFCRGNWVAPILSVGFDEKGKEVWKDWKQWNFRWCSHVGMWMNRQNSDFLEKTLPGYWDRYKDSLWGDAIKLALAWYLESNRRASGMEASIILGQTALELLGWTTLVEDNKSISNQGFMDLPAADKIRLLLVNNYVPLGIPVHLVELGKAAKAYNWADGPECLVGVRNALVHPQLKNRKKIQSISASALYEVWNLGLWYLDLIFLRLFGYTAVYSNRLKRQCTYDETLEGVPWA
jgi:hypothetical protein